MLSLAGKPGHIIDCAVDIYAFGICALEVILMGIDCQIKIAVTL